MPKDLHKQLMKDPDYARQVREGKEEDRNYREIQKASNSFHKGIKKHGYKSKALEHAKTSKPKTYMGRPIEELKREAGIGKYKDRYK